MIKIIKYNYIVGPFSKAAIIAFCIGLINPSTYKTNANEW